MKKMHLCLRFIHFSPFELICKTNKYSKWLNVDFYWHSLYVYHISCTHAFHRCFLGPNKGMAAKPDINRYIEAIVMRLYETCPSQQATESGITIHHEGLVLGAYHRIRKFITDNPIVMERTTLQLPLLNRITLTQW